MRENYIKTVWQDNRTPVNALNLNKIEDAITNLYLNAMDPSELVEGVGIKINTTHDGRLEISLETPQGLFVESESIGKFEVTNALPSPNYIEPNMMYLVINETTGNLEKITVGHITVFDLTVRNQEIKDTIETFAGSRLDALEKGKVDKSDGERLMTDLEGDVLRDLRNVATSQASSINTLILRTDCHEERVEKLESDSAFLKTDVDLLEADLGTQSSKTSLGRVKMWVEGGVLKISTYK